MEIITLYTPVQNNSSNENETAHSTLDFTTSTIVSNLLNLKAEDDTIDMIMECFKGLSMQSNVEFYEGKDEYLVGKIDSVIITLHTVIVKPFSSDSLLYVGTPLFYIFTDLETKKTTYNLLGHINDVFGSVKQPMYSVAISNNVKYALNINTKVYYFPNHPNTLHMNVQYTVDKMSKKGKYKIKIKHAKI